MMVEIDVNQLGQHIHLFYDVYRPAANAPLTMFSSFICHLSSGEWPRYQDGSRIFRT